MITFINIKTPPACSCGSRCSPSGWSPSSWISSGRSCSAPCCTPPAHPPSWRSQLQRALYIRMRTHVCVLNINRWYGQNLLNEPVDNHDSVLLLPSWPAMPWPLWEEREQRMKMSSTESTWRIWSLIDIFSLYYSCDKLLIIMLLQDTIIRNLFCENSDVRGFLWSSSPLHNFFKWHVFRSIPSLTHHEFGKW